MNEFWSNITNQFRHGTAILQLLYINIGVFLILKITSLILILFNIQPTVIMSYMELPASLHMLIRQPWTVITYMFMHLQFFHIFFNMLCLFWFGRIFLEFFNQKQLIGVYILGGLGGAASYILAYNLFPYFANHVATSYLLGASASIMGIIVSAAMIAPNYPIGILFIGDIKLKYMALIMVLISVFGVTSANAGGEFAHLGGALVGYLYALSFKRGKDMTNPINRIIDKIVTLFKRKPKMKVYRNNMKAGKVKTDAEYNQERAENAAAIDKILDKIKKSGYDSLTNEEKKQLFDRSQRV